jgi:hypothetical protein
MSLYWWLLCGVSLVFGKVLPLIWMANYWGSLTISSLAHLEIPAAISITAAIVTLSSVSLHGLIMSFQTEQVAMHLALGGYVAVPVQMSPLNLGWISGESIAPAVNPHVVLTKYIAHATTLEEMLFKILRPRLAGPVHQVLFWSSLLRHL